MKLVMLRFVYVKSAQNCYCEQSYTLPSFHLMFGVSSLRRVTTSLYGGRIRNCSTLELPCLILFRFCGKGNLVNAVYECGRFGDAKSKPDRMCVHTDRFTSVVFLNRKLNIISFK